MVDIFIYILAFILGSLVGSFLNVVSDRLPAGKSIFLGRSKCTFCKHLLSPKDLIPLLSFLVLKAKCRYCSKKLSFYYPLAEVITGFSFMGVLFFSGILESPVALYSVFRLIILLGVVCFYIVILLSDVKYRIIPDQVTFTAIAFVLIMTILFLAYRVWIQYSQLQGDAFGGYLMRAGWWHLQLFRSLKELGLTILTGVAISLFFWALIVITKGRGMGFGDVKLGLLIGLVNGFPEGILAVFLGFVIGASYSLVLMALRRKTMKDTIPFGPFLVSGSVIALLWGPQILQWYVTLL